MTRILLHGNGPNVSTGYGVQIALLSERLRDEGHPVAISCTYGAQGAACQWHGITLYPNGYEINGNDVIHGHARHHFGGDELGGWIVTLLDVWALNNPLLAEFNVAAWTPVDHFPVPPDVLRFFKRTNATPIAMSRYGERLLFDAGLAPVYIPLAVDTKVFQPTPTLEVEGRSVSARELLDIPQDAFVVGMVAMNKGWAKDRKGFNEAFRAFGMFWREHPEAILYLHAEQFGGAEGQNLVEMLQHACVPVHAVRWVDQYAYRLGVPPRMMAATYTAMDVLLAPSHGEGFCVPLIEAQACGVPVIVNDATSQPELVGVGWTLKGQPEWDQAQHSNYVVPFIDSITERLEEAYRYDLNGAQEACRTFALRYDADLVFDTYWRPFLASLGPQEAGIPTYDRSPMPTGPGTVAVIVPAMKRPQNVTPLVKSVYRTTPEAHVYFVCDPDDAAEIEMVEAAVDAYPGMVDLLISPDGETYSHKVNIGVGETTEPWVFVCGDDVEFRPGWISEARELSDRFDVIGTNDTTGSVKNPDVAAGRHSDHFFVRRAYVEAEGACLDGPGILAPEVYGHWFTDLEIIGLAKARGVFTPCLSSVVEHHHPGFQGDHGSDEVYRKALDTVTVDQATYRTRLPLIEMQRTHRGKN